MLLLVWAWTEWVCIVAGKCLVGPPPLPALRRSWGKVLVCHKGLGGVFCVSGPHVCQPKALGWSTSWRIFGCNWPLSHSWLDYPQLYCCAKSLFSPPFFVFSSPSFPRVDPYIVCPVSPTHSPSSILLPSLPLFGFCPFTPVTLPALLF